MRRRGIVDLLGLLPWLVGFGWLAMVLVMSGFQLWIFVSIWVVILGLVWALSRPFRATRPQKIVAAAVLLPLLFLAGWEGGFWLIPADLTWLVVEVVLFVAERRGAIGASR